MRIPGQDSQPYHKQYSEKYCRLELFVCDDLPNIITILIIILIIIITSTVFNLFKCELLLIRTK